MSGRSVERPPALGDRISFLAHRINAHLLRRTNPLLRKHHIDLTESRMLVALLEQGPMSAGDIVATMALPQSTVSHQTKRLEKIGYVARRQGAEDSRMVITELTAAGRAVAEEANALSSTVTDEIRVALGDDVEIVRAALKRIDAALAQP